MYSVREGGHHTMVVVRKPHHDHQCIICKGTFPCWHANCALRQDIVCDDCAEGIEVERKEDSATPC